MSHRDKDDAALADAHRNLLAALPMLEQAGEQIAAAHVASAIDAIEGGMRNRDAGGLSPERAELVDQMSRALIEMYGDRSILIARWQAREATGAGQTTWNAIASRLSASTPVK